MDSENKNYTDLSVSNMFNRNDLNEQEQAAPHGAQACTYYNTSNDPMYPVKTDDVILNCSGNQWFPVSTSDSTQTGFPFYPYASHGASPGNHVVGQAATGDMSAYQSCSPTTIPQQGVKMASPPSPLPNNEQVCEKASQKKKLRLLKNRDAARESRKKKKEYIRCLENRAAVLEFENKRLIEELRALKNLYGCKTL